MARKVFRVRHSVDRIFQSETAAYKYIHSELLIYLRANPGSGSTVRVYVSSEVNEDGKRVWQRYETLDLRDFN